MKKLTLDEAKQRFHRAGFILLESVYQNCYTPMRYECSCGQEHQIALQALPLTQGKGCPACNPKKWINRVNNKKLSYDAVKLFYLEHGCTLLESSYKGCGIPMKYRCSCGHISSTSFNNFKRYKRCIKCGRKANSGPNHFNWNPDRDYVESYYKYRFTCRRLLRRAIHCLGLNKHNNTYDMLGYTPNDLRKHIESFGVEMHSKTHIDHIFPIKAFMDYNITDLKIINHLDNLRPITAKQNLYKGHEYNEKEFLQWLQQHNKYPKIVALIPARGGSKRIKHKNIVSLNSKPLLSYAIDACNQCPNIMETWVSTNDIQIAKVAQQYNAKVHQRPKALAGDTSTSESALIEFENMSTTSFDILVFVQATSALTRPEHLTQGIKLITDGKADSCLSVCEDVRFYWNAQREPINYEPSHRPRSQEKEVWYKETGAFYITSRDSLLSSKCRISGKIEFVVVPEKDSFEIDTYDDLKIVESIMLSR